jgi:hypothetical protein
MLRLKTVDTPDYVSFGSRIELGKWKRMDNPDKDKIAYTLTLELKEDEELVRIDMDIPGEEQPSEDLFHRVLNHLSFEFYSESDGKKTEWWKETPLMLVYMRDVMTSTTNRKLFSKEFPFLCFDSFFSNGFGVPVFFLRGSYTFVLYLQKEAHWLIDDKKNCSVNVYLQLRTWKK